MLDNYDEASRSRSDKSFNEYGKNITSDISPSQVLNPKKFNINQINIRVSSEDNIRKQDEFLKNSSIPKKGNAIHSGLDKSPASSYESTISDNIDNGVKNTSNSNYGATSRR